MPQPWGLSRGCGGGGQDWTEGVSRSARSMGRKARVTERRPDGPGEAKQKPAAGGIGAGDGRRWGLRREF